MPEDITIKVGADTATARRSLAEMQRRVDNLGHASERATPKVESVGHAIDGAGDASARAVPKHLANAKAIHEVGDQSHRASRKVATLGAATKKASGKHGFLALVGVTGRLSELLKLVLIPLIFDAVGALATLGAAAAAAGMAMIGALSPVVGVAGAIAPAILTAVSAFGALKLASERIGKGLKDLKKPWNDMKKAVADATAPRFVSAIKDVANTYLPVLKRRLSETGRALGYAAQQMAGFLTASGTKRQVSGILGRNVPLIKTLSGAGVAAMRAFLNVVAAAGPLLQRMAEDATRLIQRFAEWTGRYDLAGFFDRAYESAKKVTQAVTDVVVALSNIARIGAPLGSEMGGIFGGMAARFRDFTERAEGVEKITAWFEAMKPVIWEVGYLLRDMAKALAAVSMSDTLASTLRVLRTDLLPVLVTLLEGASGRFLPALAEVLGDFISVMVETEAFSIVLEGLEKTMEGIAALVHSIPDPMKKIVGYMVTLSALVKFHGLLGFGSLVGAISGGMAGAKGPGLIAKAMNNLGFALGAVKGGAATAGEAVGLLKDQLMGWLTGAKVATGVTVALVAVLGAMALAGFVGYQQLEEMRDKAREVAGAFRDVVSAGTFSDLTANLEEANATLENFKSHNWFTGLFDTATWSDVGEVLTRGGIGLVTGDFGAAFEGFMSSEDKMREAQQTAQDAVREFYEATNAAIRQTGAKGTDQDFWLRIAEEAGVDLVNGVDAATAAMVRYYNVNYASSPVVADLYNGLTKVSDAAATAAERTTGYTDALNALAQMKGGGGATATAVEAAQAIDALADSAKDATAFVGDTRKAFTKWAKEKSNWALYGTLQQTTQAATDHAAAVLRETDSVTKANAAYKDQYQTIVGQVAKGMDITREKAKRLVDQIMATPQEVHVAFRDDGLRDLIESGASAKDVLDYIDNMVIDPKIGKKWRTGAFNYSAWQSQVPGWKGVPGAPKATNRGASIPIKTPGAIPAIANLEKIKQLTEDLSKPMPVDLRHQKVDAAQTATDLLFQSLTDLTKDPWDVIVNVKTPEKKAREGGPVWPGRWTVGEAGPELFVPESGSPFLVGVTGQEQRTFDQAGWVVPNDQLPATLSRRGGSRDAAPLPPVTVGPVYAQQDIDLERAVARGIAAAERSRRERGYR